MLPAALTAFGAPVLDVSSKLDVIDADVEVNDEVPEVVLCPAADVAGALALETTR